MASSRDALSSSPERPGCHSASARSAGLAAGDAVAGIRVSTSVTYASIVLCPVALATESAVVAVLDEMQVTDAVDVDRRDRRTAPLREIERLHPLPHPVGGGPGTRGRSRAGSRRFRPRCRAGWSSGRGSVRRASPGRRPPRRTTGCGSRLASSASQPASRASTCRSRALLKSSSTSTHDRPVLRNCTATPHMPARPWESPGVSVRRHRVLGSHGHHLVSRSHDAGTMHGAQAHRQGRKS